MFSSGPVWRSTRNDTTAAEFVTCMIALNIHFHASPRWPEQNYLLYIGMRLPYKVKRVETVVKSSDVQVREFLSPGITTRESTDITSYSKGSFRSPAANLM